jgi:hypothetical protein
MARRPRIHFPAESPRVRSIFLAFFSLGSFFFKTTNYSPATVWPLQRNFNDAMEAIDSLLSITSADISEIRLMMDVLLEVYLGKLILVFSS